MSNKKKNEQDMERILKEMSDIEDIVSKVTDNMNGLNKDVLENKPEIDFSEMEKAVELLTKAHEEGAMSNPDKGGVNDTYDYYISDTLKEIWDIVEATPNNMALGKKIRQLYFTTMEEKAAPDPIETVANTMKEDESTYEQYEANNVIDPPDETTEQLRQMELFDDKDTEQLELFDDPATKDRKRYGG